MTTLCHHTCTRSESWDQPPLHTDHLVPGMKLYNNNNKIILCIISNCMKTVHVLEGVYTSTSRDWLTGVWWRELQLITNHLSLSLIKEQVADTLVLIVCAHLHPALTMWWGQPIQQHYVALHTSWGTNTQSHYTAPLHSVTVCTCNNVWGNSLHWEVNPVPLYPWLQEQV